MTAAEWLACENPQRALQALLSEANERKRTLLACAFFRANWNLIKYRLTADAVDVMERHVDGEASKPEREEAAIAASRALLQLGDPSQRRVAEAIAEVAAMREYGWKSIPWLFSQVPPPIALIVDVLSNPSRPRIEPTWLTADVAGLARTAYSARLLPSGHFDSARLAVLSDALEEAGCSDEALLTHLRSPGPHVRGCWVVDLLLDKK